MGALSREKDRRRNLLTGLRDGQSGLSHYYCRSNYAPAFEAFIGCRRATAKLFWLQVVLALTVTELRQWSDFLPAPAVLLLPMVLLVLLQWAWLAAERAHTNALSEFSRRLFPGQAARGSGWLGLALQGLAALLLPWPVGLDSPAVESLTGVALPELLTLATLCRALTQSVKLVVYSAFNNAETTSVLSAQGVQGKRFFLVKTVFEKRGTKLTAALALGCTAIFAFVFRIAERANPSGAFDSLCDTFYFSFITFCTIGYGDIVPAGVVGRLLAILLMILGMMLLSCFTHCLTRALAMDAVEQRVFSQKEEESARQQLLAHYFRYFASLRRLAGLARDGPAALQRLHFGSVCSEKCRLSAKAAELRRIRAEGAELCLHSRHQNQLKYLLARLGRLRRDPVGARVAASLDELVRQRLGRNTL